MANNSDIKITAVIPAYNVEKYIRRSIESALNQTVKPYEILVVDDGSTDGTSEIVDKFKDKVRYVYQDNAGSSSARNLGINEAKGNWIAFLDSDDEWIDTHLECFVATYRLNPNIQWYGAPFRVLNESNKTLAFEVNKNHLKRTDKHVTFEDYMNIFPPKGYLSSPTMIVKKSVFKEVGYFDTLKKTAVDVDMWFRIGLVFPNIGYTYKEGATVYIRPNSLSTSKIWNPDVMINRIDEMIELAKESGPESLVKIKPRLNYLFGKLIKRCVKSDELESLKLVLDNYKDYLNIRNRFLIGFIVNIPFFANFIRKIKS